jgi:uncharacterized protein YjiS (DUF1127 family)
MSRTRIQGASCSGTMVAGRHQPEMQEYSLAEAIGWGEEIRLWIGCSRQRHALAHLNGHHLHDIGVSPDDAAREAAKHFWQR